MGARMLKNAIIIDLDGTLCNTDHRQHLVEAKKWPAFYEALVNDTPNEWCLKLIEGMESEYQILFVSGRPTDYRDITLAWLKKLGLEMYPLFMRASGDFRKDCIIKTEIYKEHIEPNFKVLFCVDDRKQVVDQWRELGLVCLHCAEGNF